jgi:D-alanyl-D-alanine carboxypeptidase (penicillin-binding protein 5/6)
VRKLLLLPSIVLVLAGGSLARAGSPSTPPPTPVPPFGSPSPFPTALSTPRPSQHPPKLSASSAILEDLDTGQVLFASHPDDRRAIASVTKIMTALVVLSHADPADVVRVSDAAVEQGSHNVGVSELGVQHGERLTVRQLLYALLLQSANDAAVALADHVSASTARFVALMNRAAARDGFTRTRFYSPNGLDDRGYSTARSLAAMTRVAERMPVFANIARTKFHVVPAPAQVDPRHIQNRNALLWLYRGAMGVKTGFTTKAGYCLVAAAHLGGTRLVSVVLGEPSSERSFSDAASLFDYGFHAFVPHPVIERDRAFPPVQLGVTRIPVASARGLTAWVPADNVEVPRLVTHLGTIVPPLVRGQLVGNVTAILHGLVLGSVPLVVTDAPPADQQTSHPPPTPGTSPLWRRGIDAINRAAAGLLHSIFG